MALRSLKDGIAWAMRARDARRPEPRLTTF